MKVLRTKQIKWVTRRGCVVRFNNLELVYSRNFLAHDIFLMAKAGICPTLDEFKEMVNNRKLRNTIGTEFERKYSLYSSGNKKVFCYLAHIVGVNQDDYFYNESIVSRNIIKEIYPHGNESDWDNADKIYYIDNDLTSEQIAVAKAHTVRLLDPYNYFLTPQTKNCSHTIDGFRKNIGEYKPLIDYVIFKRKEEFKESFNQFLKDALCNNVDSQNNSNETINLKYDINTSYIPSKKISVFDENTIIKVVEYFLTHSDGLEKIEIYILNKDNKKGWLAKAILDSVGVSNNKKGRLITRSLDEEIKLADSDEYRDILEKIKYNRPKL